MIPVFHTSATVSAPERLVLRGGRLTRVPLRVRWGLAEHPEAGLGLIDLGYGPALFGQRGALGIYAKLLRPRLLRGGTWQEVLAEKGAQPGDVSWVLLTHLHADHVCGLPDLAHARIFAPGVTPGLRHGVFPALLPRDWPACRTAYETLPHRPAPHGLPEGADVFGDGSCLAVPLPGHAAGQRGLVFTRCDPPLLYAADVQWCVAGLAPGRAPGAPAMWVADDRHAARESTQAVRRFADGGGDVVLCHEPGKGRHDA
ncbi:MBL fold metallo-hydrolase [Tropicimonas sp. IMCC34011]|uniref:MBL fold metallo-hydrolase n=1 Tax=Tropicimonas sp. IMCC34011 TaxID=2248759 RepID=UPI000E27927E|nr:MBL fold metallo-hydrolase [Tropicimonas sp. IMCC34011]